MAGVLREQAESRPERTFLVHGDRSLTFGQVDERAEDLSAAFRHLGVEAGDRIALDLPNWPEFIVSLFAAAKLGAVVVPLNPGSPPRELQFMLRHSETTAVVSLERRGETDYLELFESLLVELPDLQYLVTVGEEDLWYDDRIFQFEDLISSGRARRSPSAAAGAPAREESPRDDLFAILYTPGTTGEPKGVSLSHANLVRTAGATATALAMDDSDVTLCSVPLFHIFGLGPALLGALVSGSKLVLQEEFDADEALDLIERNRVSVFHGVPTMFVMALREMDERERDLSSLRTGIIAGAPVGEGLADRVRRELVPDLEIAYGLTETSPTVTITTPEDLPAPRSQTVGSPLEGVELRVLDDDGEALPVESVGELAVRGFNVMLGYFRQPKDTAGTFTRDGFFRTGDLAMIDGEGYLHIVGRKSDVIIRGGYNVHPREVEDHLRSHPAVLDAVVFGVPNDVLGELVCACVRPVEGAIITGEELREYCRPDLTDHKVPDLVHFRDVFPMTAAGRPRRAELARAIRAEEAGHAG